MRGRYEEWGGGQYTERDVARYVPEAKGNMVSVTYIVALVRTGSERQYGERDVDAVDDPLAAAAAAHAA